MGQRFEAKQIAKAADINLFRLGTKGVKQIFITFLLRYVVLRSA